MTSLQDLIAKAVQGFLFDNNNKPAADVNPELMPVKKPVTRKGKTFLQTYYVERDEGKPKVEQPGLFDAPTPTPAPTQATPAPKPTQDIPTPAPVPAQADSKEQAGSGSSKQKTLAYRAEENLLIKETRDFLERHGLLDVLTTPGFTKTIENDSVEVSIRNVNREGKNQVILSYELERGRGFIRFDVDNKGNLSLDVAHGPLAFTDAALQNPRFARDILKKLTRLADEIAFRDLVPPKTKTRDIPKLLRAAKEPAALAESAHAFLQDYGLERVLENPDYRGMFDIKQGQVLVHRFRSSNQDYVKVERVINQDTRRLIDGLVFKLNPDTKKLEFVEMTGRNSIRETRKNAGAAISVLNSILADIKASEAKPNIIDPKHGHIIQISVGYSNPTQPASIEPRNQIGHIESKLAMMLKKWGLAEKVLQGDTFHIRLQKEGYQDLVIERHKAGKEHELYVSHYYNESGDRILDSELVFTLTDDGHLFFKDAVVNFAGRHIKKPDKQFADTFLKNIRTYGYEPPKPEQSGPAAQAQAETAQEPPAPPPADPYEGQYDEHHQVGEIRTLNGRRYILNENHRWERYDKEDDQRHEHRVEGDDGTVTYSLLHMPGKKYPWVIRGRDEEADENFLVQTASDEEKAREAFERATAHLNRPEPQPATDAQADPIQEAAKQLQEAAEKVKQGEEPHEALLEAAKQLQTAEVEPEQAIEQVLDQANVEDDQRETYKQVLEHSLEAAKQLEVANKQVTDEQKEEAYELAADEVLQAAQSDPETAAEAVRAVAEMAAEHNPEVNPLQVEDKLREKVEDKLGQPLPEPEPEDEEEVPTTLERPNLDYSKELPEILEQLPTFGFELLPKSTPAQRRRANDEALELAEKLEAEGREPTPEERRILAAYTGEGGVSGDLNAHYTPTSIAAAMWKLLHDIGFQGGEVLEPSMGAGVFFETAPQSARMTGVELSPATSKVARALHPDHEVFGDQPFERFHKENRERKFSAVIANPPYGARGIAWLEQDKPELKTAENYFIDTALDHLEDGGVAAFLINAAPLEKTSPEAMDFKARLLSRAHIVGVYQLPNAVFKDSNSGVAPIILLLKKRDSEAGLALYHLWRKHGDDVLKAAGVWDDAIMEGHYHLRPENTLGEFSGLAGFKGYKKFKGSLDAEALARLNKMPRRIEQVVNQDTLEQLAQQYGADEVESARVRARTYNRVAEEGEISADGTRVYVNGAWRPVNQADLALSDALEISEMLRHMTSARNNGNRADAEMLRQRAVERLERFLKDHGNPHQIESVTAKLKDRHELANLLTAVQKDGTFASHITTPMHDHDQDADLVDRNDPHHVAQYLLGKAGLTPERLAALWSGAGGDVKKARDFLYNSPEYALTEDGRFVHADNFYHGNVYQRAQELREHAEKVLDPEKKAKYLRQADHFESLRPRKRVEEIELNPAETWMPVEAIQGFVNEILGGGEEYEVSREDGVVYIRNTGRRYRWGRKSTDPDAVERFRQFVNHALTAEAVRDKDMSPEERAAARKAAIDRANEEIAKFKAQFKQWLSSSEHRELVENEYNKRFNGFVPMRENTEPLSVESAPDWKGIKLHPFQRQSVRFLTRNNGGICALDVGLGKTLVGIAMLHELKSTGQAKKPAVVVPKSLMGGWRRDFIEAHGDGVQFVSGDEAKEDGKRHVLLIGQTYKGKDKNGKDVWVDDDGATVARKLVRLANEDWHTVLITRDWFSRIPLTRENFMRMVQTDVPFQRALALQESVEDAYKGHGRKKRGSKRDIVEKMAEAIEKAVSKMFKGGSKPLYFEDLGIDHIIVDEAHSNKNLYAAPQKFGQSIKLMGAGAESKRSQDMLYKSRLLREKNGGVSFLTATPTKNSPLEIFNMLAQVSDAFPSRGLPLPEEFIDRYCKVDTVLFPSVDGELEAKPAVVGFKNLSELRNVMSQYMFRRTATDPDVLQIPGWHVPKREDQEHTFEMHPQVKRIYDKLADSAQEAMKSYSGRDEDGTHVFTYLSDMRKLTLDPALYNEQFAQLVNPRFKKAAEISKKALDENGKVVMFMDMGKQRLTTEEESQYDDLDDDDLAELAATYHLDASLPRAELIKQIQAHEEKDALNAYERLADHLVAEGIPRDQIAIVTGETAKSVQKRAEIQQLFKEGKIRVIIGSTPIIGEGMNLQHGTTDMIHLDTPWEPGTYQQRLGRAQRQGNKLPSVRNHILLANGSFDSYTYTTMTGKKGWQDQLFNNSEDEAENTEANTNRMEEIAVMLSKNPEEMRAAIAKRKAETEEKAKVATAISHRRKIAEASIIHNSVLKRREKVKELERTIENMSRSLKSGIYRTSEIPRVEQELQTAQGRLIKEKAALQAAENTLKHMRRELASNPEYHPGVARAFDSEEPFIFNEQGQMYAPGSMFYAKDRNGDLALYRVSSVDSAKGKIAVSPKYMRYSSNGNSWVADVEDFNNSNGHHIGPFTERYAKQHIERFVDEAIKSRKFAIFHILPGLADFAPKEVARKITENLDKLPAVWVFDKNGNAQVRSRKGESPVVLEDGDEPMLPTQEHYRRVLDQQSRLSQIFQEMHDMYKKSDPQGDPWHQIAATVRLFPFPRDFTHYPNYSTGRHEYRLRIEDYSAPSETVAKAANVRRAMMKSRRAKAWN